MLLGSQENDLRTLKPDSPAMLPHVAINNVAIIFFTPPRLLDTSGWSAYARCQNALNLSNRHSMAIAYCLNCVPCSNAELSYKIV